MFSDFVKNNSLKTVNAVFEDYLWTQFFPPMQFAIDTFDWLKNQVIYSKIANNDNLKNLYIHIPFCKTRCTYCHCYTSLESGDKYKTYIDYLIKEIEQKRKHLWKKITLDSIFIWWWTPNIIWFKLLEKLLLSISHNFDISNIQQYNIDLNPYFLDVETIKVLSNNSVNRCTYAIQSFDREVLRKNSRYSDINTDHQKNIQFLQKSGIVVNIDLMVWIKWQTLRTCVSDIDYAHELKADNISLNYFIQSSNVHYQIDNEHINLINKVKKYYNHTIYNIYNSAENFQEQHYLNNKVDLIGIWNWSISHIYGEFILYNMWTNEEYYHDLDQNTSKIKKIKYLSTRDQMIKFIWLNLIYGLDIQKFKEAFWVNILDEFKNEFQFLIIQNIVKIEGINIKPIVTNLRLYLCLSIFLRDYIPWVEFPHENDFVRKNITKFFLPTGEKIDEDY